jgi:hypothetical protein
VAVLGEGRARAGEVAAALEAGVQRVQQRAADLADFPGTQGGLDGAADIAEVGLLGRHVPPGNRHVLVKQLGHGDGRVGLPSGTGERQQLA